MSSQFKLKQLILITQGHWGGAQKYVYDLALKDPQQTIVVIGNEQPNDLANKLQQAKIKTIIIPHLYRSINLWSDFLAWLEIKKIYKKLKPKIVHLNSTKVGFLGSFFQNKKIYKIYTVHGWVFSEKINILKKILYFYLEKISAFFKDEIIVLSKHDFQLGLKITNKNKLVLKPLTCSNLKFLPKKIAQTKLKIDNNKFNLVLIANFYPNKNIPNLIQALNKFKNKNWQLTIIGNGPEKTKIIKTINKYKLNDKIKLLGFIEQASQYLLAFDMLILSSSKEGLPYVILEAKQAGIPILATPVGGIPEILPKKYLFKSSQIKDLQKGLEKFLIK